MSADTAQADKPGRVRILQFLGRRRAVRLEPTFWSALERAAERRGIRLGRLVGELGEASDGRNLASYLRVFCLLESERQLASARLERAPGGGPIFRTAPAPALFLDSTATVTEINRACETWLGTGSPTVVGHPFNEAFRVRSNTPFDRIWRAHRVDRRSITRLTVLHLAPGRVSAAEATLVKLDSDGESTLVWLSSRGTRRSASQS